MYVSSFSMDQSEDDIYDLDILVEHAQALLDADQRPTTPDDPRTGPILDGVLVNYVFQIAG